MEISRNWLKIRPRQRPGFQKSRKKEKRMRLLWQGLLIWKALKRGFPV